MAVDLNGLEVGIAQVVRFWCVPLGMFVRGYISHVGGEGELSRVVCLEPAHRRGEQFWVWAADCEALKGAHGRPLHFVVGADGSDGQEVEDGTEEEAGAGR